MSSRQHYALLSSLPDVSMAAPIQITAQQATSRSWFRVRETDARSILSTTTGFIAEAGFTHSLTPARNCTYGCIYCYVPTMRLHGGLRREDWQRWGQFTTFKSNAAELLARSLRGNEVIYCSPLVDPYQPAERSRHLMPAILEAILHKPPKVFAIQTRGTLILRDLPLLLEVNRRTALRVSFSITTDREDIRKLYEPHCEPIAERLETVRVLREAGIATHATLAPLLPCDPENLARLALEATNRDLIGDPLHVRAVKRHGATTRQAAEKVSSIHSHLRWHDPAYQADLVRRISKVAAAAGRRFGVGPEGFGWLAAD
jgi:DNA repair photolyase